jgi:putative addiction module killer protein
VLEVVHFLDETGFDPFQDWFDRLRDQTAAVRILNRLGRVEAGNFGDCKSVGAGVWELRIDHGPGYRVYYARAGQTIILLLCGGDKRTQQVDIARAAGFWQQFQKRKDPR